MNFLCIDIGTSYLKSAIVSHNGTILEKARHPVSISNQHGHICMHPDEWLKALEKNLATFSHSTEIEAVAVTGNGPSLVAVNKAMELLSPAISWMDTASQEEAKKITAFAGYAYDAAFYLAKVLALLQLHALDTLGLFFSGPEYLAFLLGADPVTYLPSPGYEPFIWNQRLHSVLGLPPERFPPYVEAGKLIGKTKSGIKHLAAGIPIYSAYPDFLSAIAGTAVVEPGLVCDRTGSSETLNICSADTHGKTRLLKLPHLLPEYWNFSDGVSTS